MISNNCMELVDIVKTYPGVVALNHVSFDLKTGEVHALVGENGAGKSTLIKVLAGAIQPDQGSIIIGDQEFSSMDPLKAKECGVEVVYQEFNLMPSLTVAENIFLTEVRGNRVLVNKKDFVRKTQELFDSLGIEVNPYAYVKDLTPATMQLVEIAKAISKPTTKVLVMDEPTAPLTNKEVDILFRIIKQLKARGISIIYISHRIEEIFTVSDRVSVMRDGEMIKTLNTKETSVDELIELMVGRKLDDNFPPRTSPIGENIVFEAKNISGEGIYNISFSLREGEILGIGGLVGVGRTEMIRMIYGADKKTGGEVILDGSPIRVKSPANAVSHGLAMVPEDRKQHGVLLKMSIKDNISISILRKLSRMLVLNRKKEKETAEYYKNALRIKAPGISTIAGSLSGGNQQKVAVAKCMAANPRIMILDEPTRGIDVGAKMEIYLLMRQLCEEGMSIIMISSEMNELLGMSDRIIVLNHGRVAGELSREEATQEHVLALASGIGIKKEQ